MQGYEAMKAAKAKGQADREAEKLNRQQYKKNAPLAQQQAANEAAEALVGGPAPTGNREVLTFNVAVLVDESFLEDDPQLFDFPEPCFSLSTTIYKQSSLAMPFRQKSIVKILHL